MQQSINFCSGIFDPTSVTGGHVLQKLIYHGYERKFQLLDNTEGKYPVSCSILSVIPGHVLLRDLIIRVIVT